MTVVSNKRLVAYLRPGINPPIRSSIGCHSRWFWYNTTIENEKGDFYDYFAWYGSGSGWLWSSHFPW